MNPYKFSVFFVLKKNNHKKKLLEKNMTNFKPIFKWQWLTKYIFSSINKNPKAPQFFFSKVLHILTLFIFFKHICQP